MGKDTITSKGVILMHIYQDEFSGFWYVRIQGNEEFGPFTSKSEAIGYVSEYDKD
jgi:hypothetical protein